MISHCPYFQTKSMKEVAELVLLPYNYIISPELRKIHEIDLKGSVVIFDEAHNLVCRIFLYFTFCFQESVCEDCTSVELSTTDIAMCIKELQKAIELMQEETELIRTELVCASFILNCFRIKLRNLLEKLRKRKTSKCLISERQPLYFVCFFFQIISILFKK